MFMICGIFMHSMGIMAEFRSCNMLHKLVENHVLKDHVIARSTCLIIDVQTKFS